MSCLNERLLPHQTRNYFMPNVFLVSTSEPCFPSQGNRQSRVEMSRNKSILRSSSTGSYPYPRNHTTLMVIPSNRPAAEQQTAKIFTGVRRRPPLNRACPPIPESKSNESIMSHASRISETQQKERAVETTKDLVIENRNVVDIFHRLDTNSNIASSPDKYKRMSTTPRSPLMNVAHSVRSKLSKITKIGRNDGASSSSTSNIKTSQSFAGFRQPKTKPKRIDQNANRVIKSASMEVPKQSTSKVCIPKSSTPLNDDKIEDISDHGLIPQSEIAIVEHVSVKLEEDVLVVTKEFDKLYPGQKRSISPDIPCTTSDFVEEGNDILAVINDQNGNSGDDALESYNTLPCETFCNIDDKNTNTKSSEEKSFILEQDKDTKDDDQIQYSNLETVKFTELKLSPTLPNEYETPQPEKFLLMMKTPEALRRHHTFTIREKNNETIEIEKEEANKGIEKSSSAVQINHRAEKLVKQKSEPERFVSPERYILTVKTPEVLRKHRAFTIGVKSNEEEVKINENEDNIAKAKSVNHTAKMSRSESNKLDYCQPNPKYVMLMKTPETLRRHHTFTIRDRPKSPDYPYIEEGELTEPLATVGPPAERRRKEEEKERKRKAFESRNKPIEKYILTATTPTAFRKYQAFVVENKGLRNTTSLNFKKDLKNAAIKRSESTDSKKHSYLKLLQLDLFRGRSRERKHDKLRQKSLDERIPQSNQKYVLSTTTPNIMRKYQTFSIVDKPYESREKNNTESIESAYKKDEELPAKLNSSDIYSITATTPVTQKRQFTTGSIDCQVDLNDDNRSKSPNVPARQTVSPESRHLFVMGGRRSTTPKEEKRHQFLHDNAQSSRLHSDMDCSQSDKAELFEEKRSTLSGELTSPDEDIPMDTNLTPSEEVQDDLIVSRRLDVLMASPIEEEPEGTTSSIRDLSLHYTSNVTSRRPDPVFTPPSPPKEQFPIVTSIAKSTSTSSGNSVTNTSKATKPTQLPIKCMHNVDPMHIIELKQPSTENSRKTQKSQLASKSLRNAGKMLTPSFLRKEKKSSKKPLYPKTTSTGRQHVSEKWERKAPLAEGESSVVANSPLVENLPITLEKWCNKSPRPSVRHFTETIVEEMLDANANSMSPKLKHSQATTTNNPTHQDTGLIDDDILDQPMLVGDTFSHSSSIDCLSIHQKMNESIVSIDRSTIHESKSTNQGPSQPQRESDAKNLTKQLDVGLSEVEDIKTQLQKLNRLVNEFGVGGWEAEIIRLRKENELLRRELSEKNATIAALQSQTISP